jgi:hypothetical protein
MEDGLDWWVIWIDRTTMNRLSNEERRAVVDARLRWDIPAIRIAQEYRIGLRTVYDLVSRFLETGSVADRPRSGRPLLLTAAQVAALQQWLQAHSPIHTHEWMTSSFCCKTRRDGFSVRSSDASQLPSFTASVTYPINPSSGPIFLMLSVIIDGSTVTPFCMMPSAIIYLSMSAKGWSFVVPAEYGSTVVTVVPLRISRWTLASRWCFGQQFTTPDFDY